MKQILFVVMIVLAMTGCDKGENIDNKNDNDSKKEPSITVDKPNDISASFESKEYTVDLSKDLTGKAEASIHDYNSNFIRNIEIVKDKITFWLEENTNIERGYREGQIDIISDDKIIQSFKIYQARNFESPKMLQWCSKAATYDEDLLFDYIKKHSDKEITEFIYNLDKITEGKDSYKNYPAFAYCIEMNHDLSKIEWYLPSSDNMTSILQEKGWTYFESKAFWSNYGMSSGAMAIRFSDNHYQCLQTKYSKNDLKYVYAVRD